MSQHDSISPTTLWVISLIALGVILATGWGFMAQRQQQAEALQVKRQQAAYTTYERSTRVDNLPAEKPIELTQAQQERQNAREEARQIRSFLLEHPSVTPGAGFSAPGVQATGAAIVQAIDRVQGR